MTRYAAANQTLQQMAANVLLSCRSTALGRAAAAELPNDRKKYSVGENGGMKVDENGGIEIYVAAEKPEGVPEENWLPINRKDEDMDIVLRAYVPDLEKMKTWTAPKAEKLNN